MSDFGRVLVAGATGYVGGRLVQPLLSRGWTVRCLTRRPAHLRALVHPAIEIVEGDLMEPDGLPAALQGVDTAVYLVHSMASGADFAERDRQAAVAFADAARKAGVQRIVYLGGLGEGQDLSLHLASRQEVGRILHASGVPTVELRASIIIGSGSLSFELVRSLVERLPVMITPRWVRQRAQPIAIEDVIEALLKALEAPAPLPQIVELGGPDRVSYLELMKEYALQRHLRRLFIPVPVLSAKLSGLWLGLVTPLYARVGRALVDSLRNETVVHDPDGMRRLGLAPRSMPAAISRALHNEDAEFAATRWSDAFSSQREPARWGGERFGRRLVDSRSRTVSVSAEQAFKPIARIGGATGWYFGNWLWRLRGFLDLLVGGPGLRRGRRDPANLVEGDALDFWRVEAVEEPRLLRLRAEMRVPGRAWLQFEVEPAGSGSRIRQTAIFDAAGVAGLAYWYALYPLHSLIFRGMLQRICRSTGRPRPSAPASPEPPTAASGGELTPRSKSITPRPPPGRTPSNQQEGRRE